MLATLTPVEVGFALALVMTVGTFAFGILVAAVFHKAR